MKKLFQAVDIKKWGSKIISSALIVSMLMIDIAKAMDDQDDPRLLKVVQRIPSPKPPAADLRSIGSSSPEQSSNSSDGDSSPRSVSPSSSFQITGLDIIDSKPSSDDSSSSPEKSPLDGSKSLPIIPFPGLPSSNSQNITPPSSSPLQPLAIAPQPEDFATTPVTGSLQDRGTLPSPQVLPGSSRVTLSSQDPLRPSEKDRLLSSGTNSYGSSNSSHSSQSSSDSDENAEIGGPGHPQPESGETAFGRFVKKFTSTQPSTTGQPNVIDLRDNEILKNGGNFPLLNSEDTSIQSQGPGYGELRVDIDLDGDENLSSQPGFFSRWFSDRPFLPEKPTYTLREGALQRASQLLIPFRPTHSPENHDSDSEGDGAAHLLLIDHLNGAWLELLDALDLPAKTKTQLTDFAHQILNGKSTWVQRIGKWLIGPLIGVGFAYGMAPVYDGGILYLGNLSEAFNEFLGENASAYLIWYINYSAFPDGISRNAHLWKKGIAYFSQETKEVGRMCIAGAIATVTALIPFAYLILAENIARERFHLPNWDNVFGVAVIERGIPLLIDAFANDFYITWNSISKLEDWCRQAREVFFPSFLPPQIRSPEKIQTANQREKFDHDLTKLKRFLAGASSTVIEAIYKDVQDVIAGARSEVDLAAQKAFAAVSYLLSLGDEVQEVAKKNAKKSIAEIAFDGLKYTCLILGAPSVGLLLQLVGSTVASLFTSNVVADSIGEGFSLIAFLPFTYILAQSMDNFKNLVINKDPQGYESHPAIRLPVKVFIGIQSFIYLFQTSIAVLQSYQKWFGDQWWPFAAGIPFFIPKLMGLAYNFNGTFNEQVTTSAINGWHKVAGKCRGDSLCSSCQKDWLVRLVESSRSDLEHWDPMLINNLIKGVEIFKNEEASSSFDEI